MATQSNEVSGRLHDDQGTCAVHRCGVHQKGPDRRTVFRGRPTGCHTQWSPRFRSLSWFTTLVTIWLVLWSIFSFSHILRIIIPIDVHIFQRGFSSTTNQLWFMVPLTVGAPGACRCIGYIRSPLVLPCTSSCRRSPF